MIAVESRSDGETRELGRRLGERLQAGDVVGLRGDIGAGKTTFADGLLGGLDCAERAASPTFVLVREYPGRAPVLHLDLYRLEREEELLGIGVPELLGSGAVVVVEWCDRLGRLAPADWLEVNFDWGARDNERRIRFLPRGTRWEERLRTVELTGAAGGRSGD